MGVMGGMVSMRQGAEFFAASRNGLYRPHSPSSDVARCVDEDAYDFLGFSDTARGMGTVVKRFRLGEAAADLMSCVPRYAIFLQEEVHITVSVRTTDTIPC